MDLACLTDQRKADALKVSTTDFDHCPPTVDQSNTEKRLRIRIYDGEMRPTLCRQLTACLIDDLRFSPEPRS